MKNIKKEISDKRTKSLMKDIDVLYKITARMCNNLNNDEFLFNGKKRDKDVIWGKLYGVSISIYQMLYELDDKQPLDRPFEGDKFLSEDKDDISSHITAYE